MVFLPHETFSNGDRYLQYSTRMFIQHLVLRYTAIKPLIYSSSAKIPDKHDTGTTIIIQHRFTYTNIISIEFNIENYFLSSQLTRTNILHKQA